MIWYWEILFEITATKKVTKPDKVELRDFYRFCVKMILFFFFTVPAGCFHSLNVIWKLERKMHNLSFVQVY